MTLALSLPRTGGVFQPMIVLEVILIALAIFFFALMDRYTSACEHV